MTVGAGVSDSWSSPGLNHVLPFTLHSSSSLCCMSEYLAIESCGYLCINCSVAELFLKNSGWCLNLIK